MPTVKHRVLVGLAILGTVKRPEELRIYADQDEHNIVHVLWRLQKQSLVTFKTDKRGKREGLTNVKLTPRGKGYLATHRG